MKPKNCIYPDCFNCTLEDCDYDILEKEDFNREREIAVENSLEHMTEKQRKHHIALKKYKHSEKGKTKLQEYVENGKVAEWNKKYNSKESSKELARKRSRRQYKRMTEKLGISLSTYKAYKKKYGITEKDVEENMVIREIDKNGRISIPPKFMRLGVIGLGDACKIYPQDNKIIIEKLEVKGNEQSRTEEIQRTDVTCTDEQN